MSFSRKDCVSALKAKGFSDIEAADTVDMMLREKQKLTVDGQIARGASALAEAVEKNFDAERIANRERNRQAAITISRRIELDKYTDVVKMAGFDVLDALEARLVGSSKRMPGARQSVDARRQGLHNGWIGSFLVEVESLGEELGGGRDFILKRMAKDKDFAANIARERTTPGSTDDVAARRFADIYERLSEEMRVRMNRAGANIGKLGGRLPQWHDPSKMLTGGKQAWVDFMAGSLDAERSFPGKSPDEVRGILGRAFDTISSGMGVDLGFVERPAFRTPRNMTSSLGEHRVLHFKDGDAYTAYMERYGKGNLFDSLFGEMESGARRLALMEVFGPNPEHVVKSMLDTEIASVRRRMDSGEIDTATGTKRIKKLENAFTGGNYPQGHVARWLATLTGETQNPVNVGLAKAFSIGRSIQSFAKLGAAALSTVADGFTKASALRVNGAGFFERTSAPFLDYLSRYQGDRRVLARELGFLVQDMHGSILQRFDMADSVSGKSSSLLNMFFKYSGMLWATEQQKVGFAMRISNYLGREHGKAWTAMNADLRAMLEWHGFREAHWEVFRKHMVEGHGEKQYFNPSLARNLTDEQVRPLLPERVRNNPNVSDTTLRFELDNARVELETAARAFFADETKFAVIEPDAKTTATMTQGTRPGTFTGEAMRTIMQFKSFPVAFMQRILGGKRWKRGSVEGFDIPGMIEYAASALAYGYLAMTLKDISKNRTPRDPTNPETWFAAAMQSGGAGIYGDFFLGKVNRFGNGFLETLAGPGLGELFNVAKIVGLFMHGDPEASRDQLIRTVMGNTPGINLWFTRAAMDWLFLDNIKEWMSPGYRRRMKQNMERDFGQAQIFPY